MSSLDALIPECTQWYDANTPQIQDGYRFFGEHGEYFIISPKPAKVTLVSLMSKSNPKETFRAVYRNNAIVVIKDHGKVVTRLSAVNADGTRISIQDNNGRNEWDNLPFKDNGELYATKVV